MACLYNSFEGGCHFYDENADDIDPNLGVDSEGHCICEDDPCPTDSCNYYESNEDDEFEVELEE